MKAALTFLLAIGTVIPAAAANSNSVTSSIEEQLARYRQAVRTKDVAAALSIFDVSFRVVLPNGKIQSANSAAAELERFIKETVTMDPWTMKLGPVAIKGTVATVKVSEDFQRTFRTPGGSGQTTRELSEVLDTWMKTPKGWKLKEVKLLKHQVIRDLRPAVAMLEEQYGRFRDAVAASDVPRAVLIWTRDYAEELPNGQVLSRGQAEYNLQANLKRAIKPMDWKYTLDRMKLNGDTLQVRRNDTIVVYTKGKPGKPTKQLIKQTCADTWVKRPEGWRWRYSKTEAYSLTVNGKTTYKLGK
jgi:hypothetical protein